MHSPVNWALLGLVIERPSYAYELAQRFERTYEGVLALSSISHVYTALSALKDRGLVEEVAGTRTTRQPKPHYRATPEGLAEHRAWLLSQLGEDLRRQRLFVLQLSSLMRDPHEALEVLEDYEQRCLEHATRNGASGDAEPTALAERLAAEENRLAIGAKLDWVQYTRRELKRRASADASPLR